MIIATYSFCLYVIYRILKFTRLRLKIIFSEINEKSSIAKLFIFAYSLCLGIYPLLSIYTSYLSFYSVKSGYLIAINIDILTILFFWQFFVISDDYFKKNMFDLLWQTLSLFSVPFLLLVSVLLKQIFHIDITMFDKTDIFTLIFSSVVSFSTIKDLSKSIFSHYFDKNIQH